jgi:hypothetical protein
MEVLINIIIILVILIAIFKRMQDVAKKGGDITGQPSSPPMSHGWPERPEREPEIFGEEDTFPEPEPEPTREFKPVESPRRTFSEKIYRFEEEEKQASFPSQEAEKPGEYQPVYETARKVTDSTRKMGRHHRESGEFKLCPALASCQSELVRGIILSEILGKPIALRRENRW